MESKLQFISPVEVKERLQSGADGFVLLDIRDENEYTDWNIKGSVNIPVNSLLASGNVNGIKQALSGLPKEKEIITVCARGINCQVAAEILNTMGYKASMLKDGMKGWNENFNIFEIEFKDFTVAQFIRIGKGCLSYIVYSKSDNSTFVVDPSIFTNEYSEFIREKGLKAKYVFDTHSHADHFSGAMKLAKTLDICYYVNAIDVDSSSGLMPIKDMFPIRLGNVNVELVETPGHTDGSVSFLINNEALICGDLLLLESVGRPDLARGVEETQKGAEILFNTIQNEILKLNDSVIIFPAHFTKTELRPVKLTLKDLKEYNDSLTISDKTEFIKFITENIPVTPPNYLAIKRYNKSGMIIPMDYAEDLEIGPNRCAAR
jgi:glyoxylase-like metal-dependent hydrolase (beta-lactamase superfamily II)/rhodanese-related sulfurtransferase